MEFLARLEQQIPPDIDADLLATVKAAEKVRGEELVAAGKLRRIWRLPGRRAVMALYAVDSADELHDIISSLPLFPWMDVTVTALSSHALDAGPTGGSR
ncbi:MAG: muconolactone Delta-isomerase family protein [Nocardioidaceae bacterium]|nr:muconolactone Delta-isomerase family protein [Nocardioidaceae bacterium]